jgi:hypothetical protein
MVHTHSPVTGASVMPRSPHILPIELEPVPRAAGPVREPSRFAQTDHKPWNRIVYRDFRYWRLSGEIKNENSGGRSSSKPANTLG